MTIIFCRIVEFPISAALICIDSCSDIWPLKVCPAGEPGMMALESGTGSKSAVDEAWMSSQGSGDIGRLQAFPAGGPGVVALESGTGSGSICPTGDDACHTAGFPMFVVP